MTHHKVQQLSLKYADKVEHLGTKPVYVGDDERFHAQRVRLEDFFYDFYQGLRKALSEVEGDLLALKEKSLEPSVLKMLGRVFRQIADLTKEASPENPYMAVNKLSDWLNNKNNKVIVDNLNFIIQKFLEENKVSFSPNKGLTNLSVNGLKNLVKEIEKAKAYVDANPMLPDPREAITVPPPKLMSEQTSISEPPSPDHNKETVPGVYKAIQNLKEISNK